MRPEDDMPGPLNLRSLNQSTNRYIVGLKDRLTQKDDLEFLKDEGFKHLETFDFPEESFPNFGGDLILVEAKDAAQAERAIQRLTENPEVDYAEPDLEFELDLASEESSPQETRTPNDLKSSLWGLNNGRDTDIDAPEAWNKTVGSRTGPIIAVLDTGVDIDHPDLKDNIWTNTKEIPGNGKDDDGNGVIDDVHGYNAYDKNGNPDDKDSHGTHCAGTIGAVGNNDKGVVGVNWQTRIMPVKIFNDDAKPKTSRSAILRGISYATKNGARITSNSWGGGGWSFSIRRAFSNSKAFHVMAAGNDSKDNDEDSYYPANYGMDNSISVASISRGGSLSSFSNYGKEEVDLAAPGSSIYSTTPNGRYGYKSGTSMATPHVSGVAGLAATLNPDLSNKELKEVLMAGVDKSDKLTDKVVTGGRLNAHKTLQEAEKK
jgi:serine protease